MTTQSTAVLSGEALSDPRKRRDAALIHLDAIEGLRTELSFAPRRAPAWLVLVFTSDMCHDGCGALVQPLRVADLGRDCLKARYRCDCGEVWSCWWSKAFVLALASGELVIG